MTAPSVSLEPRRAIALPPSYAEAQRRVEILVDHDVPLQRVDSVSSDLRLGEHALLAFATAAIGGAVAIRGAVSGRDIVAPRPLNAVQGVGCPAERADGAWSGLAAGRIGATAFLRPAS